MPSEKVVFVVWFGGFFFNFKKIYREIEESYYYLPSTISVFNCRKNKCLEKIFWKTNKYTFIFTFKRYGLNGYMY